MLGMEGWPGGVCFSLITGERKTPNLQPCARILEYPSGVSSWPLYYKSSSGGDGDCNRSFRRINCRSLCAITTSDL